MNKFFLLILLCIINIASLGTEIAFEQSEDREAYLLDDGNIRINETFKWSGPTKELILNDFSKDIKRESIVIENEEIEDIIFSLRNNENEDSKDYYKGREVQYQNETYKLLSLSPLIIERVHDGKIIINPVGEMVVEPSKSKIRKNKIRIVSRNPMERLNLSYEYDGINWQKIYNVNLDNESLENIVVLKNSTSKSLKNLRLNYGPEKSIDINLDPYVEKKIDLWKRDIKIEKRYLYRTSSNASHPNIKLNILGERMHSGTSVRVIEGKRYIGSMLSKESDGSLNLDGITDNKIDITKTNDVLQFGEKFSRNSVEVSIKNYKNKSVTLEFIYDELPEKWYEMKSKVPYEMKKNEVTFQVIVPANSRKKVKFSYIMEKI